MSGLRVEGLTYAYPKASENILDQVSFLAECGVVTALIGANGTGKSTLLKTMLDIYHGTGNVFFSDVNRDHMSRKERSRIVSYMAQENPLMTSLPVLDVVLLGRMETLRLKVSEEDIGQAWKVLELLHLEELAERPFYALSGGQRRMVGIAQTIVKEPQILIMDEPTANLDVQKELEVLELIRAYTKQRNIATFLTLHDLNMAARYADRLILLHDGGIYCSGEPKEGLTEQHIRETYGIYAQVQVDADGIPLIYPVSSVQKQAYCFERR